VTRGAYRWYLLGVLAAANLLSYVVRNVVFALFDPIKRDLALTDAQLGWVASAYVLVFALAALPAGVLSDLRSRRTVIAAGILLWAGFTVGSGLAATFGGLLVCRAAVGAGGAAFGAAAQSLAADYFPGRRRAVALAVLSVGITVGGVLGIWLGGRLEAAYDWRTAFVATGLPGLGLAWLAARLRDPGRGAPVRVAAALRELHVGAAALARQFRPLVAGLAAGAVLGTVLDLLYGAESRLGTAAFGTAAGLGLALNVRSWVRQLAGVPLPGPSGLVRAFGDLAESLAVVLRTPTLVYAFLGGALISFGMNGLIGWAPTFMARELGLTVARAVTLLGSWGLAAGVAGSLFGGWLGDWLRRYTPTGRVLVVAAGILLGGGLTLWLLTIRDLALFVPVFGAAFFCLSWYNGPIAAVIFDVVPARISATVAGAYLCFIHLVGDTVAFPLVGFLSDQVGLARAVLVLPAVAVAGGVVVLGAARTVAADERAVGG